MNVTKKLTIKTNILLLCQKSFSSSLTLKVNHDFRIEIIIETICQTRNHHFLVFRGQVLSDFEKIHKVEFHNHQIKSFASVESLLEDRERTTCMNLNNLLNNCQSSSTTLKGIKPCMVLQILIHSSTSLQVGLLP